MSSRTSETTASWSPILRSIWIRRPNGTGGDNVGDLVHTKLALTTGKGSLYGDPQQIAVFGFSYVIWNAATE